MTGLSDAVSAVTLDIADKSLGRRRFGIAEVSLANGGTGAKAREGDGKAVHELATDVAASRDGNGMVVSRTRSHLTLSSMCKR